MPGKAKRESAQRCALEMVSSPRAAGLRGRRPGWCLLRLLRGDSEGTTRAGFPRGLAGQDCESFSGSLYPAACPAPQSRGGRVTRQEWLVSEPGLMAHHLLCPPAVT